MEGLVAQGLQKWFKTRKVVDNVSLDIQRGEVVGLLGPNGAGKTTSFYMMVGLLPTEGGRIFLEGQEITSLPMYQRCRMGVGYLPQESSVFRKLTVEEGEALESLRRAGVPVSRVSTLADVVADPLVAERLVQVTDPRSGLRIALPAPPVGEPPALSFPPRLGEHNEKIYGEALGLAPEWLAELRRRQIV